MKYTKSGKEIPSYNIKFKLVPAIKRQWAAVLRDPDSVKCKDRLNDGLGGYCAMGHLGKARGMTDEQLGMNDVLQQTISDMGDFSRQRTNEGWKLAQEIGKLNDKLDYTLAEIADVVESEF